MVTTSVGAEGIADARSVMETADSPDELADAIVRLYNDTALLGEMSRKALEYVKQHHSIDAVWDVVKADMT